MVGRDLGLGLEWVQGGLGLTWVGRRLGAGFQMGLSWSGLQASGEIGLVWGWIRSG